MTAFDFFAAAGWLAVLGTLVALICRHLPGRKPPLPRRTAADVMADLAQARRSRDLTTCQLIWPDPPSWRVIEAQHRHDTAKQRKENGK